MIIGLSGSGKSMLLRLLIGLHRPTGGTVEVLGVDVATAKGRALRDMRRQVGFVFQQFNIAGLTCMENVLSGALGRIRGPRYGTLTCSRALRREAIGHLERVGIADQAFQRTVTLSGGQQPRVAIARTLMQRPRPRPGRRAGGVARPGDLRPGDGGAVQGHHRGAAHRVTSLHQVELALGWAERLVGLRDGEVVLDKPAAGLDHEEVMTVYRRLDPTGERAEEYAPETIAAAVAS